MLTDRPAADHTPLLAAIDEVVRTARAVHLSPEATATLLKEAFQK